MDFIYLGEIEVPEPELSSFLGIAADLKIRGLSKYATGKNNNSIATHGVNLNPMVKMKKKCGQYV